MLGVTTFVGLDVHARSIKAVALDVLTGEIWSAGFGYGACAVADRVRPVDPAAKCVYESGGTGFDLQKRLSALGIDCAIDAVSKMVKPAADRGRKNDRNDAEFLARMLSVGSVVEVWVPDDGCEAARDLVRVLADARDEVQRSKRMPSTFLLRYGRVFDERNPGGTRKGNWTAAHWARIRRVEFDEGADSEALSYCIDRVRQAVEEKKRLEGLVGAEASKARWRRVDSLRCLKGADAITAAGPMFEASEFSGLKNARSFVAWVGLTPSEHSSDESVREGGMTKAGNKHLRRVLVEAAWHYINASPHPKDLAKGQSPDLAAGRYAGKGGAAARPEARGDARARGPQEQGERGDRPRARVLELGRRPDGGGAGRAPAAA